MDEYNSGIDPEIKRFFKKIINSFSIGLLWLLSMFTAGLFFNLGITHNGIKWYNIVFYIIAVLTFIALLFYFYRVWKKDSPLL
jgi:ABC-type bacteriocin/lantibiotic exporter with double-glycine peptidase domain